MKTEVVAQEPPQQEAVAAAGETERADGHPQTEAGPWGGRPTSLFTK